MPTFAEIDWPVMALLGASVLVIGWVLFRSYHQLARHRREDRAPPPSQGRERKPPAYDPAAPQEMVRWEVHMHDLARELSGKLDSKTAVLMQLIHEADRAAARLEAALAAERPSQEPPSEAASAPPADRDEKIYTLADYGYAPAEIARRLAMPVGEVERILSRREKRT